MRATTRAAPRAHEPAAPEQQAYPDEDIKAKFLKLQDFMNERHEKEAQVQAYLDSLKEQRPEEGKVVKEAFSNLAVEIL